MCDFDVLLVAIRLRLTLGNRQTNLCPFFALRCSIYTQLNLFERSHLCFLKYCFCESTMCNPRGRQPAEAKRNIRF